jgi:Na+/proline symporter
MTGRFGLDPIDWAIIAGYLALALAVGIAVKGRSEADKESYFLAGRGLPWWWAGLSIAATTFAADTPLAVTGIVADRGISGNWIWLSWLGVHAGVAVYFAARWRRSRTLTDAELVEVRYSGRPARSLRWLRAGLYGIVYNCIILGWVLRAMVKIVTPFFHWDIWLPGLMGMLEGVWPTDAPLGSPSEGLTIIALLAVVGVYSSLGGIRGVILTDLVQLGIALFGSVWFACSAWQAVGGRAGLVDGLAALYGPNHTYLDLLPFAEGGWLEAAGIGAFAFGVYLVVQSYANIPADGGGYLMQRLATTHDRNHAKWAATLFVVVQYLVRSWPWFVIAAAALVLVPLGGEAEALGGRGDLVAGDREMAYPVLMAHLLPPAVLGLMVTSLLAAFMSTVDTHLNWGASYVLNDVFLRVRPRASHRDQIRVARLAVLGFAVLAVLVSFQIETIEQAWKWVAALGAALGIPTALRWLWWRVNAAGEIGAMAVGLGTALVLAVATDLAYEVSLVVTSAASLAGMVAGMILGPRTEPVVIARFTETVVPHGLWPDRPLRAGLAQLGRALGRWLSFVGGTVAILVAIHRALFFGHVWLPAVLAMLGSSAMWLGARDRGRSAPADPQGNK